MDYKVLIMNLYLLNFKVGLCMLITAYIGHMYEIGHMCEIYHVSNLQTSLAQPWICKAFIPTLGPPEILTLHVANFL